MNAEEFRQRRKLAAKEEEIRKEALSRKHRACAKDLLGPMLDKISKSPETTGSIAFGLLENLLVSPTCRGFLDHSRFDRGLEHEMNIRLKQRQIPVEILPTEQWRLYWKVKDEK